MSVKSLLYTCTAATYRSCPSSLNTLYMYVYYVLFSSYIDDKWCLINVPRCHSSQSCTLVLLLPKLICSLIGCYLSIWFLPTWILIGQLSLHFWSYHGTFKPKHFKTDTQPSKIHSDNEEIDNWYQDSCTVNMIITCCHEWLYYLLKSWIPMDRGWLLPWLFIIWSNNYLLNILVLCCYLG